MSWIVQHHHFVALAARLAADDVPEAPEASEAPEAPEAPVNPEAGEAPDTTLSEDMGEMFPSFDGMLEPYDAVKYVLTNGLAANEWQEAALLGILHQIVNQKIPLDHAHLSEALEAAASE